jgi:hypothetical protein
MDELELANKFDREQPQLRAVDRRVQPELVAKLHICGITARAAR